jgi:hypothetical protein
LPEGTVKSAFLEICPKTKSPEVLCFGAFFFKLNYFLAVTFLVVAFFVAGLAFLTSDFPGLSVPYGLLAIAL